MERNKKKSYQEKTKMKEYDYELAYELGAEVMKDKM